MGDDGVRKLRVGIVGANWGTLGHLPGWRLLADEVEVTAICTSRPETAEAAARQYGIPRAFSNYEEMAADPDIDIIDATSTPALREKVVAAALDRGKHVVNNIPFATSLDAARQIETLRRRKGVLGVASTSVVGLPHLALMKEMIDAGEIGDVYQVDCAWQMGFFLHIIPDFPYTWFGKEGLGVSVTRNHGSHMLHAMRHAFGPIDAVIGNMQTQLKTWSLANGETMTVETDDTCHAMLRFASGAMGTFRTSWTAADNPGFTIEAFGSKGRIRITALRYPSVETAKIYFAKSGMAWEPTGTELTVPDRLLLVSGQRVGPDPGDVYNGAQRVSLARNFQTLVHAIRDGGEPLPSFARAVEIQTIIEALYESRDHKTWVETPRDG